MITIDTNESIDIYAICLYGWGKGKTIAEALRNMRESSRGFVDAKFTADLKNGKSKRCNIADAIDAQVVRLFATNQTEGIAIEWYTPRPKDGKWVLFLGDADNTAQFYTA